MHLFPIQLLAVTLVQGNPCAHVKAKNKSVYHRTYLVWGPIALRSQPAAICNPRRLALLNATTKGAEGLCQVG